MSAAAEPVTGWRLDEPPKDGKTIVAYGRVLWTDEEGGESIPLLAEIRWVQTGSGYEGWVHAANEVSVAFSLSEQVVIDAWIMPPPPQAP